MIALNFEGDLFFNDFLSEMRSEKRIVNHSQKRKEIGIFYDSNFIFIQVDFHMRKYT